VSREGGEVCPSASASAAAFGCESSGAMYEGVPEMAPVRVSCGVLELDDE
jgi:hypothetical protein